MFLFTKDTKVFRPKYRILIDKDSREPSLPRTQNGFPNYRAAFYCLVIFYVLTAALTFIAWRYPAILPSRKEWPSRSEIPHDQKVIFIENKDFEASTPKEGIPVADPWEELLPAGRGFIEVPVEVARQDGSMEVQQQYYCISMFHQLHCIASLKAAFDSLSDMSHSSHSSSHNHPIEHLGHCFDYLRQAVMCAADTTLEPTEDLKSLGVKVVDGWNVTHQCRNYEAVYEFAERHRYLNSSGTL